MKKRYLILIIIFSFILLIGVGAYLNYVTEKNRKDKLTRQSKLFVNKWATFKDGASAEYLEKIRPYVSDDIYNDHKDSAVEIREAREKGGKTIESVFIYKTDPVIKKEDKTYKVTIDGERSYVGFRRFDQKIFITWTTNDKKSYTITELYTEDK